MTNDAAKQIAASLDATLTDLVALGLLAKHGHWNLAGPGFSPLHLLLDEVADVAREAGDRVAERAITLGHHPDGRLATIAGNDVLPALGAGALRDRDAIAAFDRILDVVTSRLREAFDTSAEDLVTQDLLVGITAELEKRAWMVRAQR
jgi:starvation-inducible DNA-binding protein